MSRPSATEINADLAERCTLSTPLEIIALMREIRDRRAIVTLRADTGSSSLISVVIDVDPQHGQVLFDASGAAARQAQLTDAACVLADAAIDKIRIHFSTGRAKLVIHGGQTALASPLPLTALRIQRRGEFRIATPVVEPLYCRVRDTVDGRERLLKVHDISTIGLALTQPPGEAKLEPGPVLEQCRLDLPGVGVVHAGLEVVEVHERKIPAGSRRLVGCRFVGLPGPEATVLQRYIINLQRRL
jgi:c-di-GMP-binding flagellar brake protein YcgR